MRPFLFTLLVTLLPLVPSVALAATPPALVPNTTPTYQVNVIVFRNRMPWLDGNEQWAQEKAAPLRGLRRAILPVTGLSDTSPLAPALAKLSSNPDYKILLVANWLQPGVEYQQVTPTRIEDASGNLDGTITVYKLLYLHANIDLAFAPHTTVAGTPAEPAAIPVTGNGAVMATPAGGTGANGSDIPGTATGPVVYRMIEHRRIGAEEVEYFDHPKFGLLLEVTRLKTAP
ncbi:MAG: CsiV family protein [Acidiferrobacteraceae bacterium]